MTELDHGSTLRLGLDLARSVSLRQLLARPRRIAPPRLLALGIGTPSSPPRAIAHGLAVAAAPQSGAVPAPERTGDFSAAGSTRAFDPVASRRFWRDAGDGLLFLFALHGFAGLAAYAARGSDPSGDRFWARVVESWLDSESTPTLPAWHPYPTSVRIMSWSAALSIADAWPQQLRQRMSASLWRQSRYLRRCIEHDIGGNHVLKNATALVFAGAVFSESMLLEAGLRVLERELDRQVLADGGHEERSTSYHREILGDLLDVEELLGRLGRPMPGWLERAHRAMRGWQAALKGPDRRLPLLNDAWEGPPVDGPPSDEPVTALRESGYFVFRHGGDQAILDAGPLCPRHLPPHAHADALSFVLWIEGAPIAIDAGTYGYEGPERDWFRSTRAHNTVEVAGTDQCRFWGPFRASQLPTVRAGPVRDCGGALMVHACHDGYRRLGERLEHHRVFVWWPGRGVVVVDWLDASRPHQVRSSLQLAPTCTVGPDRRVGPITVTSLGAPYEEVEGAYAPVFGKRVAAPRLEYRAVCGPGAAFGWALLRPHAAAVLDEAARLRLHEPDREEVLVPLPRQLTRVTKGSDPGAVPAPRQTTPANGR
jgi:hypothetical protein